MTPLPCATSVIICTPTNLFIQRAQMKIQLVDATLVDHLVKMHVAMYVGGQGGTYKTPEVVSRPNQA